MKKLLIFILLCTLSACAAPDLGPEQMLPESGYLFHTGKDDLAGDLYIGITDLEHADSGKVVVLVPMVHTGDADFFRRVQEELDRADVVLMEGVWGAPSLSPTLFFINYLLSSQRRLAYHMNHVWEGEGLVYRPNWRWADLSLGQPV